RLAGHEQALRRPHFEALDVRVLLARFGGAVFEPALEQVVLARLLREALAALVLHDERRLEQQDAALRVGRHDAATLVALHDLLVVERGVEAEQAQAEAAAPRRRAEAGAAVAPPPRQPAHQLARGPARGPRAR